MRVLQQAAGVAGGNVIPFRASINEAQQVYLRRWLTAGRCMGLHDGHVCAGRGRGEPPGSYIVIWVRENADPAYIVAPEGQFWRVRDNIRDVALGSFRSLEAALRFIRPVLLMGVAMLLSPLLG